MVIDLLIALGISLLASALAMGIYHLRFKGGLFSKIGLNVAICLFIIVLGVFLFTIFGFNIWTIVIIPLLSLTVLYIVIRNAVAKLLDTSAPSSSSSE